MKNTRVTTGKRMVPRYDLGISTVCRWQTTLKKWVTMNVLKEVVRHPVWLNP